MKLIGAIAALLVTYSLRAQDYKIARFEADDYRTFSTEELTEMLGKNSVLLPDLKCNGVSEFDPFHKPIRMNPLRNSLKIKASKADVLLTYQLGHFFDESGNEVTTFEDPFFQFVSKALLRFEELRPTRDLLRQLEESHFSLTIAFGNNSFNPQIEDGRFWSGIKMAMGIAFFTTKRMSPGGPLFYDMGVGGQILWNPKLAIDSIESDGIRRKLDPDVALAHEMYHAFDSIRGMLDMGLVQGDNYEFESVLEYRAVYFENLFRRELGTKLRKHYGNPLTPESPDLLDDKGDPIYIPAPCLMD